MNKSTELYANTPPIDCVNELYSLNYTLLQLQTGVKSASRGPFVYTREDIFGKSTPAEDFFSEKIELTAEFRNKYILKRRMRVNIFFQPTLFQKIFIKHINYTKMVIGLHLIL